MFKINIIDNRTASLSGVLMVNFEHISHFCLVFQLLILNIYWLTATECEI